MLIKRKAEMGVGTLIVFIAMLLVAAVAAAVLIQTVGSLQEQSLSTGSQAEAQISTNAEVIEVSASDGRNGNLTDFQQFMKLSPGSDPIKLDQVIFTFNTKDSTATLKFRGTDSICQKNNVDGYNTYGAETVDSNVDNDTNDYTLEDDLDDDGSDDYFYVNQSGTYLIFNLSSITELINISLEGANLNDTTGGEVVSVTNSPVAYNGTIYAYVTISGTSTTNYTLDSGITMTCAASENSGEGYFSATYEQTGTNWINGNLQRGDMIRICYEAPAEITEDEDVRLNFIPKIGTATLTNFVTPDVIATERVYLYP